MSNGLRAPTDDTVNAERRLDTELEIMVAEILKSSATNDVAENLAVMMSSMLSERLARQKMVFEQRLDELTTAHAAEIDRKDAQVLELKALYQKELKKNFVPILPDDLLLLIFDELEVEDRGNLGTSCKRFRDLDFRLGGKTFDCISVDMSSQQLIASARAPGTEHNLIQDVSDPVYHISRLFRKAQTTTLEIVHDTVISCVQIDTQFVRNVLRKISFQKLKITACCEQDCTENLIHNLIGNRFLEKATTSIHWICKGQDRSTLQRTRKFLGQMPKIDKFKLTWETEVKKARALIDDATLLTLLSKTNHLELSCKTECSAQGMMDVFQAYIASEKKCISFVTPSSSVNQFMDMARTNLWKTGGELPQEKRFVSVPACRRILWAFPSSTHRRPKHASIMIGRMDANKNTKFDRVDWP